MKKTKPENMNRLLTLMLLSVTVLLSCRREEAVIAPGTVGLSTSAMQFSSYLERSKNSIPYTKADEQTHVNPLGEDGSFNMRAYYNIDATHQQRFYSCVEYKWDGKQYFVSSPVYYWPVSGTIDFYAVSPTTFTPDSVMNVTISDGRTDLLAAKAFDRTRAKSVTMAFGHKLTKLSFKAVGTDKTLSYEITSIRVEADSSAILHFGKAEADTARWSDNQFPKEYEFLDTTLVVPVTTATPAHAIAGKGTLMLIPKQDSITLSVTYTAKYGEFPVAAGTKKVGIKSDSSKFKWGINKHVTYTLNLTPDTTPITFTATTGDWGDTEEKNVDVKEQTE